MRITLPDLYVVDEARARNPIRQLGERGATVDGALAEFYRGRLRGFLFRPSDGRGEVLILPKHRQLPDGHARIVEGNLDPTQDAADLSQAVWARHPLVNPRPNAVERADEIRQIIESWGNAFAYVAEDATRGTIGLRGPQLGALHAVHAHWCVSETPATIVMPTGTGKTETMLSILITTPCPKLLVVVPTDALRSQLASKFITLGVLRAPGCAVLRPAARYPIVCALRHTPRGTDEIDDIFEHSQVVITTSSIAALCDRAVQDRMAQHCPYLFIDEAHHAEAPTWRAFKERFSERRIVQFTATPFREDGRPLDGDIIFNYPLKRAQQEGYFKPIQFRSVVEFSRERSDRAIATVAIDQLRRDAAKGHILMARVGTVARAKEVFALYKEFAEFNPVELHTGITSSQERDAIRRRIISGEARIVVCVDMLGEGFDLPQLKIAAFHDIRKSIAVTLQLAGRFTRVHPDLGEATFIANTADVDVKEELRRLYTQDPDWNLLLPPLSEQLIGEQVALQEFIRGFPELTKEITPKALRPAMSAVVYKTACTEWTPDDFRDGLPSLGASGQVYQSINRAKHTLLLVTVRRAPLRWAEVESIFSWEWDLYVVIWSAEQNLLFIHGSSNAGEFKGLAKAVGGENATLINGQIVFRSFSGVNRLCLQNVGLTEQLGRNVRYTGRMGSDVETAMPDVLRRRARKSLLVGNGYEDGAKVSVGASRKGRIWSHRRDRVSDLVAWCKKIGAKLLDESIDPDEVLKGTLDSKTVSVRPAKVPVLVDWPEEIYKCQEGMWSIFVGTREYAIDQVDLEVTSHETDGPLRFAIVTDDRRIELELVLFEKDESSDCKFACGSTLDVAVRRGNSTAENIVDFFYESPPTIWFSDGSLLEGNQYVELRHERAPYDTNKIEAWNWTGTNIREESQGDAKNPKSIQATVIRELRARNYQVVVDDDGKGEAADVVAIRLADTAASPSSIDVEFYHCKFSQADTPGERVKDLYEVCGQAQKSVWWMSSPEKRTDLFTHLLRRAARHADAGTRDCYEVGDKDLLRQIREMSRVCPVTLKIFVVQPGVSKARASRPQLELLSVTETYLMETYQLTFGVIASS